MSNLPGDWQFMLFEKLAKRSSERFDPRGEDQVLPCVQLEHIEQGTGRIVGHEFSNQQASIMNRFHPQQVLFGKLRPYLRKYAFPDFEGVCSSEIWVFDAVSEFCLPEYLFYVVQSDPFVEATTITAGSKMPRVEWNIVAASTIPLPPLAEQRRIAAVLGTWDEAIRLVGELIAALKQRKHGLMQRLLTGEMRESWEQVSIDQVTQIILSNVDKVIHDDEIPVRLCNYMNVFGKIYISDDTSFAVGSATHNEVTRFTLQKLEAVMN